jgi:phage terminase large subunit
MKEEGVKSYDKIIADSAEPKSIEDLYRAGFKGIKGANKRANYKADMVNVLRSYKIHLIEGDIDLQREFSTWSWARDKNDRQLPKPADGSDHYIDSCIMLLHEYRGTNEMRAAEFSFNL